MSLDKAIRYGKEHRKPYTGSRAVDRSCRCHGGCPYCEGNRRYREKRLLEAAYLAVKEYRLDTAG